MDPCDLLEDLKQAFRKIIGSGTIDPSLIRMIGLVRHNPAIWAKALDDPELKNLLLASGADTSGGGTTGDIGMYYRDGSEKYALRWPLELPVDLPIPFVDLDRKTQFFVLFNEWSRREMEGMLALNSGRTDKAELIFNECIERAEQIDVAELEARSYEGLMRTAQKRGDSVSEKKWIAAARMARLGGNR